MSDITAVKRMLADRAREVAEHLLPRGILDGREWCAGSVAGEVGKSLKVCVSGAKAGTWADFADGGMSGDLIDLWRFTKSLGLSEALAQARSWLGIEAPKFDKAAKRWRRPDRPKCTAPQSAVLTYLTDERKISHGAIQAYRVGEDGRTMIFPLLLPDGTLANIKRRAIDREPGKQPKTWAEADCEPVLFGWQAIDQDAREVSICEGEIDALTLFDFCIPALSVPFGGGKGEKQRWIEAEYERLLQFETIYIATDMDGEGEAAAEEIANRLGRHRCRRVRLPHKDANACRLAGMTADDVRACFDTAVALDPPELRRPSEFTDDVIGLFWPTGKQEAGYRLPFAKLRNQLVFRPGELTIWTGPTGHGKSQLLGHACVGFGDQGASVCIASLEMAPRQLIRRLVKQAGNTDRPTEPYIREIISWLDDWAWVFAVTGKSPIKRLLEVFEYARARYGCDTFVVDSLMRLGVGPEDYEAQEKAVFELVNWTVEKNVHLHLVAHSRKADRQSPGIPDAEDIKGTSEIANNAFNVLSVWRNKKLEDELRQAAENAERGDAEAEEKLRELSDKPPVILGIAKQRNGDWEGKVGLWFNPITYQYRSAHDRRDGMTYVSLSRQTAEAA